MIKDKTLDVVKLKLNHIEMSGNSESWQDESSENQETGEFNNNLQSSQGCVLLRLESEEEERNYYDDIDPKDLIAEVFMGR